MPYGTGYQNSGGSKPKAKKKSAKKKTAKKSKTSFTEAVNKRMGGGY